MEMNSKLFDELTANYKSERQKWVAYNGPTLYILNDEAMVSRLIFFFNLHGQVISHPLYRDSFNALKCEIISASCWGNFPLTSLLALSYFKPQSFYDRERRREKEREELWRRLDKLNVGAQPTSPTSSPSRTRRRKKSNSDYSNFSSGMYNLI